MTSDIDFDYLDRYPAPERDDVVSKTIDVDSIEKESSEDSLDLATRQEIE